MVQFGPIRMDSTVRRDLETLLLNGFQKFIAKISNVDTNISIKSDGLSIG